MKATDLKPGVYIADVGSTSETHVKVMGKTSVNFYYGFSPFETTSLSDTATRPTSGVSIVHMTLKISRYSFKDGSDGTPFAEL